MRQHLIVLALCASAAHAEPTKREKLDVSEAIGKVDVLRDETGKYYVMPKVFGEDGAAAEKWTFYGDGRTMYLQRIVLFSTEHGNITVGAWSPRVRSVPHAILEKTKDGAASLICRMQSSKYVRRPLKLLSEADATKLLKSARFEPVFWERRVFFFGRGDASKYYLVDMLRDEYGGAGFRLFVGPKGQMKQIAISDVADDTGGASVTTKLGELRVEPKNNGAVWKQGKKMVAVTRLDPQPNAFLIYRELGVYGQLGAVCEDQ
ncbi:MAG: hypothetical protein M4D80_02885 [Myxococcota bacterium]|nr:hypothetical protein [Myxococcota bacterium]